MSENRNYAQDGLPTMIPIKEAVRLFPGFSYYYFRNACLSGKIVHVRCGDKFLINLEKLVEYFKEGDSVDA